MPLTNLLWEKSFFWDGRAKTLREQVLHPIKDPIEMALPLEIAIERIGKDSKYQQAFQAAFGSAEVTADRIALALEQYLHTEISGDAKFDRAVQKKAEFTESEKRGLQLFMTEFDPDNGLHGADCFHCHGGYLFTSHELTNNGLDADFLKDKGLYESTGQPSDIGKFKVPSLRNVALTAPYMHDGRFKTLEEVIDHYDHGIQKSPTLDPNIAKHPTLGLRLKPQQKSDLIAFLKTLTDYRFAKNDS